MSVWRIATDEGPLPGDLDEGAPSIRDQFSNFIDKVVKWIPGDIAAIYAAGIVGFSGQANGGVPSTAWWILSAAAALVITFFLSLKHAGGPRGSAVRALLAAAAFFIWSATIPSSGWATFDWFADNARIVPWFAGVIGLMFTAFAEWATEAIPNP
ncbi:hypothetical protein GFY24_03745 [Nocardia sp. SYP-A9097]|uniref:hypothetical protein n=1 Tax=Nocardia sp. SYP-A9097 TaxID=2663237 RepID=UPI00129A21FB|nr:hypothetical protein [Nocardia sp. SYP-A9097]MRH86592.1 hypothetical protein [Nocardia sp. SYP-A9097]